MTALATTDDVAIVARAVPDADTDQVEGLLEMVSARVRRYTGLTFDVVEDDEITVDPIDGTLTVPQWPVTEVAATQRGVAVTTQIGSSGRIFRLVNGVKQPWLPYPVSIVYTHGWTDIPRDIVQVVAEVAAAQWNASTNNPTGVARTTATDVGGFSDSITYRLAADTAQAWSPAHLEILDSYAPPRSGTVRMTT